jgi:hypothetical protein
MFGIQGRTLCASCAEQFIAEHPGQRGVARQVDPTVCAGCGADNGDVPHERLMGLPACAKCLQFYRHRPFPRWVKLGFAGLAALVLVSLAWNWRFFEAYFEIKGALARMHQRDLAGAARQATAAAAHVPEAADLQELAAFFQGLVFLQADQCQKAEGCFARAGHLPPAYRVAEMEQQAAMGAAFDRHDYDRFLQFAEEMAERHPRDAVLQAQVASALACQYAVHGDAALRARAEAKLAEAKRIGNVAVQAVHYEERIRHRLETREIIGGQEFMKRFPHGWKPSGASKS